MQWMLACSCGIAVISFISNLPSLYFCFPLIVAGLLAFKYKRIKIIGAVCLGLCWGILYGHYALSFQLAPQFEAKDLVLIGRVAGLPRADSEVLRFEFAVDEVQLPQGEVLDLRLRKVRLSWFQAQEVRLLPGALWRLPVRLKRPHGHMNPGGFDYETWLFQRQIDATGYVQKRGAEQLSSAEHYRLLDQMRFRLYEMLQTASDGLHHQGLISALLMGEKSDLDPVLWRTFAHTGTNHLFVISGLHIGLVAFSCYGLVMGVGRWLPLGAPWVAKQQVAAIIALCGALLYSAMAGFALPTQRALLMLLAFLLGQLFKLNLPLGFGYCLALLLVLIFDPIAARSAGFWLSFGAVGALLYGAFGYTRHQGFWWRWVRPQLLIFLLFIPVLLFFFGQFSWLSPLANSVAIPWIGFLVVPLCLLGGVLLWLSMDAATWIFGWVDRLLDPMLQGLSWLGSEPSFLLRASPDVPALVVACVALLWLCAPRGIPARWLALFLLLPLALGRPRIKEQEFNVLVFDVGQGLSVLVETRDHRLLYDVGPAYSKRFNSANNVLLPYLQRRAVNELDAIVISHGDMDHAGALPYLLEHIPTSRLIADNKVAQRVGYASTRCQDGMSWHWDGVTFELLRAPLMPSMSENNRSCLVRITNGTHSLLLAGDVEQEAERSLVSKRGQGLRADILLAPHHGSRTSSTREFIDQVAPGWVVFSRGYRNRFRHPSREVVKRYRKIEAELLDTAMQGAVGFYVGTKYPEIQVTRYRDERQGYWYFRADKQEAAP